MPIRQRFTPCLKAYMQRCCCYDIAAMLTLICYGYVDVMLRALCSHAYASSIRRRPGASRLAIKGLLDA